MSATPGFALLDMRRLQIGPVTVRGDDADVDTAVHAADERLLKKGRKSRRCRGTLLHVLQLGRVHQTLRVTPAMEAGVSNHVWSIEEIVGLL